VGTHKSFSFVRVLKGRHHSSCHSGEICSKSSRGKRRWRAVKDEEEEEEEGAWEGEEEEGA
jgi:hypothetical protein